MIKYSGLKTLESLGEARKYNTWIMDQFMPYLSEPLLEIGSGTGTIAEYLIKKKQLYLSDNDAGLVSLLQKKFKHNKSIHIFSLDITKPIPKQYLYFFESIIGINVLEHIEHDQEALENMTALLKKNGRLLLLVPANQFAYTDIDKTVGHFRRYERKELQEKLKKSGYIIEKLYPFNIVGLFGWFMLQKLPGRSQNLHIGHIRIFEFFVPFFRSFESIVRIPLGISFIVIARKK